ncbi:MAG: GTPase (G3E family), partial [Ruminococcus sp.]|nr:GTPase (G3E family) [Ruminococcus sp.]
DVLADGLKDLTDADYDILSKAGYRGSSYVKKYLPEEISSAVHYFMNICIADDKVNDLLKAIFSDNNCGRIYRIKGALPSSEGGWLRINAANEKIEITPIDEGQSVLIVIGDNVDKRAVDGHIRPLNTDPEYVCV